MLRLPVWFSQISSPCWDSHQHHQGIKQTFVCPRKQWTPNNFLLTSFLCIFLAYIVVLHLFLFVFPLFSLKTDKDCSKVLNLLHLSVLYFLSCWSKYKILTVLGVAAHNSLLDPSFFFFLFCHFTNAKKIFWSIFIIWYFLLVPSFCHFTIAEEQNIIFVVSSDRSSYSDSGLLYNVRGHFLRFRAFLPIYLVFLFENWMQIDNNWPWGPWWL